MVYQLGHNLIYKHPGFQEFDVAKFEHIKDPVFELEIEAGFRRLLSSLKQAGQPAG